MKEGSASILLVDDKKENLDKLKEHVRRALELPEDVVCGWDLRDPLKGILRREYSSYCRFFVRFAL